jgi:hypothetical protein
MCRLRDGLKFYKTAYYCIRYQNSHTWLCDMVCLVPIYIPLWSLSCPVLSCPVLVCLAYFCYRTYSTWYHAMCYIRYLVGTYPVPDHN